MVKWVTGKAVLIDASDESVFDSFSWTISNNGYVTGQRRGPGARLAPKQYLHRVLLNADRGQLVDHADRDKLNNQRHNLRFCTRSQNAANAKKKSDGLSSGFKGVCFDKGTGRWVAYVGSTWLGRFDSELEAAAAYRSAARKMYGKFFCEGKPCQSA